LPQARRIVDSGDENGPARALDPCRGAEGLWALGTRMVRPELSTPAAGKKDRGLRGREWSGQSSRSLTRARRIVGSGDENAER